MALTRKYLAALGIEDDKVDEIITAHSDTVNGLKAERDELKAEITALQKDNDSLKGAKKELDEIKEAQKDEKNPFEVKYNALKEEFNEYKKEQEAAKTHTAKSEAYRNLLKEIGISEKRIEAVLKVSDVDAIELDEEGNIKDSDKLKEAKKEEWADFIVSESSKGANTPTPPKNGGSTMTKADIMKVKDTQERQRLIAENRELFGF